MTTTARMVAAELCAKRAYESIIIIKIKRIKSRLCLNIEISPLPANSLPDLLGGCKLFLGEDELFLKT